MKKIFALACLILSFQSLGQQLQFDQIGFDPAYYRLFHYQTGNGVLYCSATGGVPPYTYQWINIQTQTLVTNSTWGGINPGDYEATVWDSNGDSIVQVITVDSVNPQAAIGIVPGTVFGSDPIYTGAAPVTVEFINQSIGFANPNNPNADTTFFWRMTQFESWIVRHSLIPNEQYPYTYSGDWEISLVARNKNGCTDTTSIYLWLTGTAGEDKLSAQQFTVITNPDQYQLIISSTEMQVAEINVYDLSGKLVFSGNVNSTFEQIQFDHKGTFVYELIDSNKNQLIQSGKFNM